MSINKINEILNCVFKGTPLSFNIRMNYFHNFSDVLQMLHRQQFDVVKKMIDQNEFMLESLRSGDHSLLMYVVLLSHSSSFDFLCKIPQDFSVVDAKGSNITQYIVLKDDEDGVAKLKLFSEQTTRETFARLVNHLDVSGRSSLHVAAKRNFHGTIKFLIQNGADVNIRNDKGQLPEEQKLCNDETKNIIRSYRE